jgi:hypothetical protein
MTAKVNGGVQKGFWAERKVDFITLTFSADVTTSAFDVTDSVLVKAMELIQQRGTVIAVGPLYNGGTQVDVLFGSSQGWPSDDGTTGILPAPVTLDGFDDTGAAFSADLNTIVYAAFSGLDAYPTGDLIEFPEGSGEYWTADRFGPENKS